MEETPAAAPPSAPATQPVPGPVMDVVAPPASEAVAVKPAPPQLDDDPDNKTVPADTPKAKDAAKAKPKTPPKAEKPGNGTGMAIFATIVIVFGLAALATYAFLKTQN